MPLTVRDVAERVYAVTTGVSEGTEPPRGMLTKRGPLGVLIATGDRFAAARELRATGDPLDAAIAEAAVSVADTYFALLRQGSEAVDPVRVWAWDEAAMVSLAEAAETEGWV